jgi:DNA-binding transcriptional ArsR family regulator
MSPANDLHPPAAELRLVKVLAAVADPARWRSSGRSTRAARRHATGCRTGLVISRSTFSHHQRVLREAGVVRVRLSGSERLLDLPRHDLDAQFPGLLDAVLSTPDELVAPAPAGGGLVVEPRG